MLRDDPCLKILYDILCLISFFFVLVYLGRQLSPALPCDDARACLRFSRRIATVTSPMRDQHDHCDKTYQHHVCLVRRRYYRPSASKCVRYRFKQTLQKGSHWASGCPSGCVDSESGWAVNKGALPISSQMATEHEMLCKSSNSRSNKLNHGANNWAIRPERYC